MRKMYPFRVDRDSKLRLHIKANVVCNIFGLSIVANTDKDKYVFAWVYKITSPRNNVNECSHFSMSLRYRRQLS